MVKPQVRMLGSHISHMALHSVWRDSGVTQQQAETLIHSGADARFVLLGGRFVSGDTLLRFYVLHCVAIPLAAALLIAVHFWRVRKDGGISGAL